MILGTGVDLVRIDRFDQWTTYSTMRLKKIFTSQELIFCRALNNVLLPEKLATRFAAKEALYKALSACLVELGINKKTFSLSAFCKYVSIVLNEWGVPIFNIDWDGISYLCDAPIPHLRANLSLSHEKAMAIAFVIIEKV